MNDDAKKPDRDTLASDEAFWADDPEQNLTEAELDHILEYFRESESARDPRLRSSIKRQFQIFMVMAEKERFLVQDARPGKVSKPSTIVDKEMNRLLKACEMLDKQLTELDPVTRTWANEYFKEIDARDNENKRVRLRHIEEQISGPLDALISAALSAEGITKRGPDNMAQRRMVEALAGCWEICFGEPPTTDNAQGRKDDPFLELCQEITRIAHVRLKAKGGSLGTLNLSGIVAVVLKARRS
jgi:hypothetical protein